jgi:hypothetical protein
MAYDLAQVNIMRLRAPLASEELRGFVAALDPINGLADAAPGFVWRLQTEEGNSTALRAFEDDTLLVNMSTWSSRESLSDFVYRSAHVEIMRRRREFAIPILEAYVALWWIKTGARPTLAQAEERLRFLRERGPSPFAFGVRSPFPPPNTAKAAIGRSDDTCPA